MTLLKTMVTPRHQPFIVSTYRSYSHSPTDTPAEYSMLAGAYDWIFCQIAMIFVSMHTSSCIIKTAYAIQGVRFGGISHLKQCVMKFSSSLITSFSLTTDEYKLIRKTFFFLHHENVCLKFLLNEVIEAFF